MEEYYNKNLLKICKERGKWEAQQEMVLLKSELKQTLSTMSKKMD